MMGCDSGGCSKYDSGSVIQIIYTYHLCDEQGDRLTPMAFSIVGNT